MNNYYFFVEFIKFLNLYLNKKKINRMKLFVCKSSLYTR